MKIEEILKLIDLEKKATPRPWYVRHMDDDMRMGALAISRRPQTLNAENMRDGTWPGEDFIAACLIQSPPYAVIDDNRYEENAELISCIRNNLPEILQLAILALKHNK